VKNNSVFRHVTACSLEEICRRFGGRYYIHLQYRRLQTKKETGMQVHLDEQDMEKHGQWNISPVFPNVTQCSLVKV
jgi:hypothetical protein